MLVTKCLFETFALTIMDLSLYLRHSIRISSCGTLKQVSILGPLLHINSIVSLGQVKQRFHTGHRAFCVKFNPDDDKQDTFLAGMQNKKVIQWDTRSGEITQEYDRHLGAVNSITFFDENRRFCTTSDDKSIRIWEWGIPVDTKLIQNAGMHSIPTMTKAPSGIKQFFTRLMILTILFRKVDCWTID